MVQVSPAAQQELLRLCRRKLAQRDASLDIAIAPVRLAIAPGGCKGHQYQLDIGVQPQPEDHVTIYQPSPKTSSSRNSSKTALQILVHPKDWDWLETVILDYSEDLMGGNFRFVNAKLPAACSCGQSFTLP